MMHVEGGMTDSIIRALLIDIEGTAVPAAFFRETLDPLVRERFAHFIGEHLDDEEIEEALEETGRLMGGFDLEPQQASSLLLRWMKQGRKAAPLKRIQGRIWSEGFETGTLSAHLYPDVAAALDAWAAAGIAIYGYSSASVLGQRLLLGPFADRFSGFFDMAVGQKIEDIAYRAIAEQLGLQGGTILAVGTQEDELDAARSAGLATAFIARDGETAGTHPAFPDLVTLTQG
jgi:enolase-phosphatase E1